MPRNLSAGLFRYLGLDIPVKLVEREPPRCSVDCLSRPSENVDVLSVDNDIEVSCKRIEGPRGDQADKSLERVRQVPAAGKIPEEDLPEVAT